ncbi:putative ribosomal protein L6, partial [Rhodotorula sp. JG-1b]
LHSSATASSHVGSAAIPVPSTVTIQLPSLAAAAPGATQAQAIVKGPKGQLAVELASFVRLTQQQQQEGAEGQASSLDHLVVGIENPAVKHQRAVWGLTRALLANAVVGVSEGYTLPIRLVGVGYRASVEDIPPSSRISTPASRPTQRLNLKLGFAHPVLIDLPPDVTATTPAPNAIALSGIDKQRLGQVAAQIRAWRVPEPYNASCRIFVGDEQVRRKEVKKK